ncbi:MAG: hypothetical protein SVM79_06230, partial [Chloroflexota bacterium]|nr:hypothetical protein [Chloroflexota bacterium]
MAEEPGGPKGEIPWEEIWQRITGKKDNAAKGKPVNKAPVIWIIVGVVVVIWLLTGIYTVGPGEKGVVKRFGAHSGTTDPGLHYHLPSPFETVDKV